MQPNTKYTQVIDKQTGEIKYVPETPPTPPPRPPQNGTAGPNDKYEPKEGDPIKRKADKSMERDFGRVVEDLDVSTDTKLTDILSSLITNAKKLRFNRRLTGGKLDGNRLVSYKTSDRLFKKKAIKYRKYRFSFLIDTSGSMFEGGDGGYNTGKLAISISTVTKMCKTLDAIGIQTSVTAMNLSTRYLKAFDEPFNYDQFVERMKENTSGCYSDEDDEYCNIGGTSEAVAYDEVVKYIHETAQPKQEDVLVILSDGRPNGDSEFTPVLMPGDEKERQVPYDDEKNDRTELRNFWKGVSDIRVYGLGIMSDARQVPHAKRLDDIKKLPEVINHLIQNILI